MKTRAWTASVPGVVTLLVLVGLALPTLSPAWATQYVAEQVRVTCNRWPDCSTPEAFGKSCVTIEGAHTAEQKAIAIWKFIQQITEVGSPPKEPAYGNYYILSPTKLLNVYGVHWCDGLSRIMTMTWRAMGYRAEKLYKFGHTLADCWWKDTDGVSRWHVFDLSQHWFVYDRSGTHIATPDELSIDHSLMFFPSRTPIPSKPSLMQPSYVHAGHLRIKPHNMGLNLRDGETIRFQWGNEGKPYYNLFRKKKRRDFEHGPYDITYGNGRLTYCPPLRKERFLRSLSQGSVNLSCSEMDGLSPALHPAQPGKRAVGIIQFSIPYVISDAWVEAKVQKNSARDFVRFSVSTDGGKRWRTVWDSGLKTGHIRCEKRDFCPPFDPSRARKVKMVTPFGRYDFLFRIEMEAANDVKGCGIDQLKLVVVFQHNLFSLPMLMPGENRITVRGAIKKGFALRVHYTWEDASGRDRTSDVVAENLPFQYGVSTSGGRWNDVICKSMTLSLARKSEAKFNTGAGQHGTVQERRSSRGKVTSIGKFIGKYYPGPLMSAAYYGRDLKRLLGKEKASQDDPAALKRLSRLVAHDVLALGSLRDPSAKEILKQVIKRDISHPFKNKVWACQALYQSVGAMSAPMMLKVLERDNSILWNDPRHRWSQDAMWLHTMSMATAILARIGDFPGRQRAADIIADTLEGKGMSHNPKEIWRGKEICWGLIKALGKLGASKHNVVLKKFLPEHSDATALAVKALQDIGDRSVVQDLIDLLQDYRYSPIGLYCIEALGALGKKSQARYLYPFLHHWDEDFRGAAARSLGEMGDTDAISLIQGMIKKEKYPWVRLVATSALKKLRAKYEGDELHEKDSQARLFGGSPSS